ncbi:hypothetical protein [Rickettsia akari]|nr:hypothetical protein [Rickettsia akari]
MSLNIPVNEIYTAAVCQMVVEVNLNNLNTNFNPQFVDGNTIEVINYGNITVSNSGTHNIGVLYELIKK